MGQEVKKIEVPDGVLSKKAYIEWKTAEAALNSHPKRYYHLKDRDESVDCFMPVYSLKRKKDELFLGNEEDFQECIKRSNFFITERGKLLKYRYKAIGKSSKNNGIPLLLDRSAEILEMFGKYLTVTEVHKVITTEWNLPYVTIKQINHFQRQNIEAIKKLQETYVQSYNDLRLVHKKSRLQELSELYNDRKQKYKDTGKEPDYKLLLQTIEAIRKEIEGNKYTLDAAVKVDIDIALNSHIQQEVLREVNINQLIVAKVAARLGVNGMYLMEKLESSFYAKFTGFKKPDNNRQTDPINYPSQQLYNFDEIRLKDAQKRKEYEDAKIVEEETSIEEQEVMEEIRDKLKEALKKKLGQAKNK